MEKMTEIMIKDKELYGIAEKVLNNERLSFSDGMRLFNSYDLNTIGSLASIVNEKKNGKNVYFNVNVHITPTNICIGTCRFCAFRRRKGEDGAYELSIDEMMEKLKSYKKKNPNISEVHIVGGLHPDWTYQHYIDIVKAMKSVDPTIHVKAFTVAEIDYMAKLGNTTIERAISDLMDAGLGSIPGGGGEIFNPSVRNKICPDKISGDRYLYIHKTAHRMGLKSNATMLFGHIENYEDRIDHLLRLREAQDETGGFQSFIPLAFHPIGTQIPNANYTTGFDELKTLAISRLMLDNFQHIKAYWIMLGEKISQVSLSFGVDDLDGTVMEEDITQAAGARAGEYMPKSRLIRLIREAGKVPVERDTLYNVLKVYE